MLRIQKLKLKKKRARQRKALREMSSVVMRLASSKMVGVAVDVAKVAIDLTSSGGSQDQGLLKVSPDGVSLGDRVRCNVVVKRKTTIPKNTPGNIIGFDPESRKYLVLFFPVWFPQGVLALVSEKEITFIAKPRIEEDSEQVFGPESQNGPNPPRSSIVQAFSDEILAKNGLAVAGSWSVFPGKGDKTWTLKAVVKRHGVFAPKGNKRAAGEVVEAIVETMTSEVVEGIKTSGVEAFAKIISVSAKAKKIEHKDLPSYPCLEITYQAV